MLTLTYALFWLALAVYVAHLISGRRWVGLAATGTTLTAWGLLTARLVERGLEAGHWPLTNRYEFALCFVWAIVAVYLLLEASWRTDVGCPQRWAGAFVLGMALLVATYAITRPAGERATAPLLPTRTTSLESDSTFALLISAPSPGPFERPRLEACRASSAARPWLRRPRSRPPAPRSV